MAPEYIRANGAVASCHNSRRRRRAAYAMAICHCMPSLISPGTASPHTPHRIAVHRPGSMSSIWFGTCIS
eukprot:10898459-Heterocapsa_arctica.AAC.1